MLTVSLNDDKKTKHHTQNGRLVAAVILGLAGLAAAFNMDLIGGLLLQSGRADLATPCYEVMTTFARDMHIQDVRTAEALGHLADCYAAQERWDEAIKLEQQSGAMYSAVIGAESTAAIVANATIAKYLNAKGNYVRSEMILSDAVQELERKPTADTEASAVVYANLADALMGQRKYTQALVVLEKLLPIDERYMMLKQQSVESYDKLAELYARLGRDTLSIQTLEAGLAIKERILGAHHVQVASSQQKLLKSQAAKVAFPSGG